MKDFTLAEIAKACNGEYVGDESLKNTKITSVERDSRQVKNGSLFLAIKGERVDGHDFIEKCFAQGAVCALCEKAPENATKPCIVVSSTLDAVKKIGRAYREKFDIPVIGISGSVGKTSTKEMLYAVLSQKFKTHKTQGNLNNELGVPLTLLSMPEDTEAAVIEMGISDFGEMTRLSEMVQPTICVLTIIGECHLENLGNRDGVLKAKTEMFKNARENADFILNGDDDKLSTVKTVNGKKPVFFGLDAKNDFYAKNIKNSGDGKVLATLCFDNNNIDVEIPAIGTYMVTNALAAAAAGKLLGLTDEEIANGVASYKTVGSRANVINTGKIKIIDDCYNANPTSHVETAKCPVCSEASAMEKAVQFVKSHAPEALMLHSYTTASVVAWVMYQKYANSMPLYRQEQDWKQLGVLLNRATLANWIIHCATQYFKPLYDICTVNC